VDAKNIEKIVAAFVCDPHTDIERKRGEEVLDVAGNARSRVAGEEQLDFATGRKGWEWKPRGSGAINVDEFLGQKPRSVFAKPIM